jgi:hypothetical protein
VGTCLCDPRDGKRLYVLEFREGVAAVKTTRFAAGQRTAMGTDIWQFPATTVSEAEAKFRQFVEHLTGVHPEHVVLPGDPPYCAFHGCAAELHYHEPPVVDWRCPKCWEEGRR